MNEQPAPFAPKNLLLIRERDVGLFSTVHQVLNTLFVLEDHAIDRKPVVILGKGIAYFHADGFNDRRTAWEYYFEPVNPEVSEDTVFDFLGDRTEDILDCQRKLLERQRALIEFPGELGALPPLTAEDGQTLSEFANKTKSLNWQSTESFLPTIDGLESIDKGEPRDIYARLIKRHIRPRQHIREIVDEFYTSRLNGSFVIGVHVRGTDGFSAPARGIQIPFAQYFKKIEMILGKLQGAPWKIFLATDEEYVVQLFKEKYDDHLHYYDARRNVDHQNVFGKGPTGQLMPSYIVSDENAASQNGQDATVEFSLLCRCDVLIHNVSSISRIAGFCVPESFPV